METTHRAYVGDSRTLSSVADDSVELVVTSPPYPMIEIWDDLFADLDPAVDDALERGDGAAAFDAMHALLEPVWDELARVLVDGGIACVNVGDATRTIDGSFRVYPNHARILEAFEERGFDPLPDVLWRKPANSAAKFMGSGMIPPNAYVTLEHEYVLVFRNGSDRRRFEPGASRRYEAAYFWEERNRWFTDVWTDVRGELQALEDPDSERGSDASAGRDGGGESAAKPAADTAGDLRDRSAAYPLEIPFRLVCMYSAYGDTVLDPFWGTGTTSLAAMCAGRNSIGYELESSFLDVFDERVSSVDALSRRIGRARLERHRAFVERYRADGNDLAYEADHYDVPVVTKMESEIRLYEVAEVSRRSDDGGIGYRVEHVPIETGRRVESADGRPADVDPGPGRE
ncbi:DNA-methyltransferase [Natrialbaceae archaeon GCM10025810]|uniref:DNA-methyltransferase n=1 Tax=Halovalidus salilacus TaxID=3075124 RepID=UPI00361C70F3